MRTWITGELHDGVLITFLPAFLLMVSGSLGICEHDPWDADFGWIGIVVGNSVRLGAVWGTVLIVVIDLAIVALDIVWQRMKVDTGWTPGAQRDKLLSQREASPA